MVIFNHIPSSNKRPLPLQPEDYDHEIFLVDDSARPGSSKRSRSRSLPNTLETALAASSESPSRRNSTEQLRKRTQLKNEITKRKYAKYQDRRESTGQEATINVEPPTPDEANRDEEVRGRPLSSATIKTRRPRDAPEQVIDILYENQRGGFLCGIPLFSSKALGAADLQPWTYVNFKPSATDITNAQPPDPSWEWASPSWQVNHDEGVDQEGWEYSFMFSKKFSWHGPRWYNSYVRRRAWIRKRVKKDTGYKSMEGHMLNSDYFTIHPNQARNRSTSASGTGSARDNRYSAAALARKEQEEAMVFENILDIAHLMRSLRYCRIDREKTEAVESFVQHGEDDLYYLKEHMHQIMCSFIFQASRRNLLSHLSHQFDKAIVSRKKKQEDTHDAREENDEARRVEYLEAAVKAADEEVKRLEFWSDIKGMAEEGETIGAVDKAKGWGNEWRGLENSMPKDVISERDMPGFGEGKDNTACEETSDAEPNGKVEKGKGR